MERVSARRDNVLRLWAYLLELLRARRARLELSLQLQQNFQVRYFLLSSRFKCQSDECVYPVLY